MKYGLFVQESVAVDNGYGDYSTKQFNVLKSFTTEEDFLEWIKENALKQYNPRVITGYIRFEDIEIETTLTAKVKS